MELLTVIAIITFIASLIIASLSSARAKSRDGRRLSDIKSIQNALELYYSTNQAYPTAAGVGVCLGGTDDPVDNPSSVSYKLITANFIPSIPRDPLQPASCNGTIVLGTGSSYYRYKSGAGGKYTLFFWIETSIPGTESMLPICTPPCAKQVTP